MIRTIAPGVVALLLASAAGPGVLAREPDAVQRSFGGNAVHLDLSTGHYRISVSPDDRIRVRPRAPHDQVSTRIAVNLLGTRATVRVAGPKDGVHADIELPARVRVAVELAGGSLRVNGLRGSTEWTGRSEHDFRLDLDTGRITPTH